LETLAVARLALRKRVGADVIQSIPVGESSLPEGCELVRRRQQFQFGGHGCFHETILLSFCVHNLAKGGRGFLPRALGCGHPPRTNREDLPPPFRRLNEVCAPGYTGRKRGQVVRTRTVISQAHRFQWLGSFGNRGNGRNPRGAAQGPGGHCLVSRCLSASTSPHAPATRWAIRDRGRPRLSGRVRVRDPRQRLQSACSSAGPGTSASAPRSVPATSGKSDGAQPRAPPQTCPWGPKACATAWSSQRIQLLTRPFTSRVQNLYNREACVERLDERLGSQEK
jgi:hypothetical protein